MTAPFDFHDDMCLSFFALHYDAGKLVLPPGARVLEIGCAESDFLTPMRAARPDLTVTGVDVRPCPMPGTVVADILTWAAPPASFEAVVGVSSVEHIGLGAYGDPRDPDGDIHTMARVAQWLVPGGWVYLDVPFSTDLQGYAVHSNYRRYSPSTLTRLIPAGLTVAWTALMITGHPDSPYLSMLLTKDGPP